MKLKGYTNWQRKTIDNDLFKHGNAFQVFFLLVTRGTHTDKKEKKSFKTGSGLISYKEIQERTNLNKGRVYRALRFLKENGYIVTRKTTRGIHFHVLKYAKYNTHKK